MKDSVYSDEDIINNVLGSKKILKNEIIFKDSENKENTSLIHTFLIQYNQKCMIFVTS